MWQKRYDAPLVLHPKHAALFCAAAAGLSDEIGWKGEDQVEFASAVFDSMSQGQQQAAILIVCKAILDPEAEALP